MSYRELFKHHVEGKLLDAIRFAANKGRMLGNGRFESEVERLTGRRMTAKQMGRPIGWRKKNADKYDPSYSYQNLMGVGG